MRHTRKQQIIHCREAYFLFSVYTCASVSLPAFLWLTGPLPLSLPCPSYRSSGHSGTHDPVCGKRWERSGSTKGLTAINFAQATFTIIQRDSRLIALTLSPRRVCLSQRSPFSVNTKELSRLAFIRGAESVLEGMWAWTVGFLFFSALFFSFLFSSLLYFPFIFSWHCYLNSL